VPPIQRPDITQCRRSSETRDAPQRFTRIQG
jgi:hypothetical protein